MPQTIGNGVTLQGLRSEDFVYTWNVTGTAGVNPGVGIPVSQDVAANASVKVPADGDFILGELRSYEHRVQEGVTVGAVAHKGNFTWPYTGAAPTRGASVVASATPGSVKAAALAVGNYARVVEVDATALTVTVMLG